MCGDYHPVKSFLTKGGHKKTYCPECTKFYKRNAYRKNPVPALALAKKYAEDNKESYENYQKKYRETHREYLRKMAVQYRKDHAKEIKERNAVRCTTPKYLAQQRARHRRRMETDAEYRTQKNNSSKKAKHRFYYKNRESILAQLKESYWSNLEESRKTRIRAAVLWRQRHPEKYRAIQSRRKAIRKGAEAEGFNDTEFRKALYIEQNGKCCHCGTNLDRKHHLDHLFPISRGGGHSKNNLALSCPTCNISKNNKLLWLEWTPALIKIRFFANLGANANHTLHCWWAPDAETIPSGLAE